MNGLGLQPKMGYSKLTLHIEPNEENTEIVLRIVSEEGNSIDNETLSFLLEEYIRRLGPKNDISLN